MQAFMVIGLGFGDEGKGSMVEYLTRLHGAKLVVRFNGGCQAAHNVMGPGGLHHTFSQFGSGTLAGAATHLAPGMLVEPFSLLHEADVLKSKGVREPLRHITIDPECVITTPYHQYANQLRESLRGNSPHGTCGRGIGETRSDELGGLALRFKHLKYPKETKAILERIQNRKREEFTELWGPLYRPADIAEMYLAFWLQVQPGTFTLAYALNPGNVVFEGAQGVLLDQVHGNAPHNTWTDCTFTNANDVLFTGPTGLRIKRVTRIGVLRTYATRYGVGPFPSEDSNLGFEEPHNPSDGVQGPFRLGHFDVVMGRYALNCVGGVDQLAITHVDRFHDRHYDFTWSEQYQHRIGHSICVPQHASLLDGYKAIVKATRRDPVEVIEELLRTPVGYTSNGPAFHHKAERKSVLARA